MKNSLKKAFTILLLMMSFKESTAQTSNLVSMDTNGKLIYTPDSKGNIVPDFSGVGYMNSESSIPTIAVVKTVNAVAGDNWMNVQNAINEVAVLPLDSNGFRGTILFKSGTYELSNTINITTSGIVLRGEGFDGIGTNFVATKTSQHTLFNFAGANGKSSISSSTKKITDAYVPIGKKQLTVASGHTFVVGDKVLVHRIPNDAWISLLGMDKISLADPLAIDWTADAYDVYSERKVTAVSGNVITLDAPIMDVIDLVYSTGELMKYTSSRIEKCGIENVRISSYYASDTDELHGWTAVSFANIANAWARNIEAYYFGYSAVHITGTASWVTVDNCKMQDAKSIITGSRRYSFNVDGQRNLVTNCTTKNGRHDYVNGSRTCGPNVFYNNTSTIQNSDIGPHHRWSTGVLFDNIVGDGSQDVQNRLDAGSGHGWSGGQIMFWNCTAGKMILQDPPGDERNWAIGCKATEITNVGTVVTESLGTVESQGTPIAAIPSLFQVQLSERLANLLSVKEVNLLDENDGISIFPNPAKDNITIKREIRISSPLAIDIYDAIGQRVKILAVNQNQLVTKYNISDLKEGIYFVHFTAVDFSKTMKLVVKK